MGPEEDKNTPNPGEDMPPEDGGQQDTPPEKDTDRQPQVVGPQKRGKKAWLLWIIIVLLIAAAAAFAWLWWQEKDENDNEASNASSKSEQQQEEKTETAACAEGLTEYKNEDLAIVFCYPTEWGEVTVADAKFAEADTGQRWNVQFADKPMVNLGVVTEDWTTEVARDYTCVDPAVTALPAFSPFSTDWNTTDDTPVSYASRGIEVMADKYLINEEVDSLLTSGVCVHGYTVIENETYPHTSATYYAEFNDTVTSPQEHMDDPNVLVSESDREAFYSFVKSVKNLETES